MEIFNAMKLTSLSPNFYTYSAVISVCSKSGAIPTALKIFSEMKVTCQKDKSMAPDGSIYRLLISAARNSGNHELVLELFNEAEGLGLVLDECTLMCALSASMQLKLWSKVAEILNLLQYVWVQEDGIKNRTSTKWESGKDKEKRKSEGQAFERRDCYLRIIDGCAENGDSKLAVEIMLTMQMVGEQIDEPALSGVMKAAAAAGDADTGLSVLHQMLVHGFEIPHKTQNCLMKLLWSTGRNEDACMVSGLLEDMNQAWALRSTKA